ncbi:MAG: TIGR02302 family protein [Rubellimicrobium sp.]|nr:TIGR02302 family protein [Rubellimicrobium sp.]
MVAERLARAFWPLWSVLLAAMAPAMLGWLDFLPDWALWIYFGTALVGVIGTAVRGGMLFRWPSFDEALTRVDASMPGRPIAALQDQQAVGAGDGASEALWLAHLRRMAARTREARPVRPDLRMAPRDPYGLRYMALTLFVTAVLFGSLMRVGDVADSVIPGDPSMLAGGPAWEGWIEPPAYTRRPSFYLADLRQGRIEVPQGSRITIRLYDDAGGLQVFETVSDNPVTGGPVPEQAPGRLQFTADGDGRIEIAGDGGAAWNLQIIPDLPPFVSFSGEITVDAMGEFNQPFIAQDDYGVVAGRATIALDPERVTRRHGLTIEPDARAPLVLDLPMPFSGDRTDFTQSLIENLSEHPLANLPVTIALTVEDAAGQEYTTEPEPLILPGRRFFQPMARAVIEQRRDLLWSRDNARRVLQILRAVSYRPEDIFTNETTYLRLSFTLRQLSGFLQEAAFDEEAQDEIAQALWDLAIQLEDGTLADARERLRRAQERLSEAMRNGASDEEIAELMRELREATDDYLNMLAQNPEPGQDQTDQPSTAQQQSEQITWDEIQALMDRIQELMEEGRMAEAADLMDQLNALLENLRVTEGQGGEGSGPRSPGQQAMDELADALRDQQDLSDQAFRDLQDQFNNRQPGADQGAQQGEGQEQGEGAGQGAGQDQPQGEGQGQGQGQGDDQTGEGAGGRDPGETLADRQRALRDELERQRQNLPGLSGEAADAARSALERAEGAMDGAEEALRGGRLAEAIDRQAEAMDALRDGLRNLGEAVARNRDDMDEGEQGEGFAQGRAEPGQRDPLGRQLGQSGDLGTDRSMLQGENVYRRAEEILGEIRRRAAEQERPEVELDYLRRLLERF